MGGVGESDGFAFGDDDVGVVHEAVDERRCDAGVDELVEPGGVQVRRDDDGALFVAGVDEAVEAFGGVRGDGEEPMSSMMTRSALRIGVNALVIVSSMRCRRISVARSSMENHATMWPVSMACWPRASQKWLFPVPDGPQTTRFSARPTHSRLRRASWVGCGIGLRAGSQTSKVFPAGNLAFLRLFSMVARSRAFGFSDQEDPERLGGVPALCFGGEQHVGHLLADVFESEPATQRDEFVEDRRGDRSHRPPPPSPSPSPLPLSLVLVP